MHSADMLTAQKIKEARDFLGESQAVFGERFGVDQSTVHRWETDGPPTRGPGRKMIQQVIQQNVPAEAAQ